MCRVLTIITHLPTPSELHARFLETNYLELVCNIFWSSERVGSSRVLLYGRAGKGEEREGTGRDEAAELRAVSYQRCCSKKTGVFGRVEAYYGLNLLVLVWGAVAGGCR